jgi:hypothetical protein
MKAILNQNIYFEKNLILIKQLLIFDQTLFEINNFK